MDFMGALWRTPRRGGFMAKIVGWAVVAAFFTGLFVDTANKHGLASAAVIWGTAIGVTGAVVWAIGAIVYNDWWPFRYL